MAAQGLRSITVPCSTSYPCERGLRRAAAVRVRACRAESMVMTDNHSILGVRRNASRNEIKRAYRRLARLYHPDVCKDRESEQRFKQINGAYESIIKDFSRFQPETGFVCSIEDLFKSTAEAEAVPDIFGDGDWFEGLNFNNPSYYQSSFMHEIMDEEAFRVTDIEEDQHKKSDDCPAWMEY